MKYLLDASALLLLIKTANATSTVECLQQSLILDLTFYEIGNAIWKESTLTKFLTPKETETLGTIAQTILAKTSRLANDAKAFQKILEVAQTERLSFYDSSYIFAAKETALTLVTEDKELKTKARKHVTTCTVEALSPK